MKDCKGRNISIGDRVKFVWHFDNRIHMGEITKINDKFIEIDVFSRKIAIRDKTRIEKILPVKP